MPMAKTMHEYKAGTLHSGSKKGPVVKNRAQAIAIGLSEERKMGYKAPKSKGKAHNTKIDMGISGEKVTRDEQQMVPSSEMHSAENAPTKMGVHEMYAPANPGKHLSDLHSEHASLAARHTAMGNHEMAAHHRGMADAFAHMGTVGAHSPSDSGHAQTTHYGNPHQPSHVGFANYEKMPGLLGAHTAGPGQNQDSHEGPGYGIAKMGKRGNAESMPGLHGTHTAGLAKNQTTGSYTKKMTNKSSGKRG